MAETLRGLLAEAAAQFRFYEQQHRAKGTPESDDKAAVNADYAKRIERALARSRAELEERAALAVLPTCLRRFGPQRGVQEAFRVGRLFADEAHK